MNLAVTLAIIVFSYFGIAIGRWPKIKSNRATITLMGVGLLVAFGQIKFENISQFLDFDTLILLFSMMIINANLRIAGFFNLAGTALFKMTRSPKIFLAVEIFLVGLLSSLFLNDTICIMFTPLILQILTSLKRPPIPYLISLAAAANIGSVATLTGNPQNMIVGTNSGIPYIEFLIAMIPIALIGLLITWLVMIKVYPHEFNTEKYPETELLIADINKPMLGKTLVVSGLLVIAFLSGIPIAKAAFLASCFFLFTRKVQPHLIFAEFDWGLLVFFSGLFVLSGTLEQNGITSLLFSRMNITNQTGIWQLAAISAILSNLVSNVPAVLLLKPIITNLNNPHAGWLVLAASSTLAGNLTLLGSVANLIVAEIAAQWRVELNFWEYTRTGFIITLLTLGFGTIWLQLFYW